MLMPTPTLTLTLALLPFAFSGHRFGAASARVGFKVAIIAIGLAGQQRLHLVGIGAFGQRLERCQTFAYRILIALGLAQFNEFDGIGHFILFIEMFYDSFKIIFFYIRISSP